MNELKPLLRKFVKAVGDLGIPYVIVGGFAIAGWGRYRATMDVDVIMDFKKKDVASLASALKKAGFLVKVEDLLDALRNKEHVSVFNADTIFHVDLKGVYGKSEAFTLQSRVLIRFQDYEIPISGLEDTIANKLRFGREQDIEDAVAIIVRNKDKIKKGRLVLLCQEYGMEKELRALERKARMAERKETKPDRYR
jgi:hypothetical protein